MDFFISFVLKQMLVLSWHELGGHLAVAQLIFGVKGGVVKIGRMVLYADIPGLESMPLFESTCIAFAGGIVSAICCYIFWLLERDLEDRVVWRANGLMQFLYGTTEGVLWALGMFHLIFSLGFLAQLVAAVYAFKTSKEMWEDPYSFNGPEIDESLITDTT